ncbi:hypothetical protein [Lactobacillus brevis] [Lactiplantibacillus mudanjiangensis]|uniref:hypothetical protein n=1 Tax=Lactiplantibacillus mudanjiangensis TaxID=1296538 RepID=UPI0010158FB9|nr:hypothetical protein [Lactobacillus brevis] [Lactiplantibacillus mudanjiangensis]
MEKTEMKKPKVDINHLGDKDYKRKVEWTEDKQEHSRVATLRDPGYEVAMQIRSKANIGNNESDNGEMVNMLLENVLVSPRLAFEDLDNRLPKKFKEKTVTLDGKHNSKVTIKMIFPGYRAALNYSSDIHGINGSDNYLPILTDMNKTVFRDSSTGKPIDMEFWSEHGGGVKAVQKAVNYFNDVLNHDGFTATVNTLVTFLGECL